MAKMYFEQDGNLSFLEDKTISIIGLATREMRRRRICAIAA